MGRGVNDWDCVNADPDLTSDLGYECVELEFRLAHGRGIDFVVVVPADPMPFGDDAYVVTTTDVVCDLEHMV